MDARREPYIFDQMLFDALHLILAADQTSNQNSTSSDLDMALKEMPSQQKYLQPPGTAPGEILRSQAGHQYCQNHGTEIRAETLWLDQMYSG